MPKTSGVQKKDYDSCPEGFSEVPLTAKKWKTEYAGYGKVVYRQNMIFMKPKEARIPQSTHASLVLSKFDILSKNFDIVVDYKNETALRKQNPNPWEVFWLFFNYVPGAHNVKTTNYVVAKPNGIEMGRAAGLTDQAFIKTTEFPQAKFDEWHRLRVHKIDGALKIYFNEEFVFDIPANQIFTANGKLGLYSEDASVAVKRICLNSDIQLRR